MTSIESSAVDEVSLVVADTGPLIALARIDAVALLRELHQRIYVPRTVADELAAGGARVGGDLLARHSWIEVRTPQHAPDRLLREELDPGEADAIALAVELNARVLLDERRARRIALRVYRLDVRGTVGLLTEARRRELIPALAPLLERLVREGIHLSPKLVDEALRAVGERNG